MFGFGQSIGLLLFGASVFQPEVSHNEGSGVHSMPVQEAVFVQGSKHPDAPQELKDWKLLIGQWSVSQRYRDIKTGKWRDGDMAKWDFSYGMDGWAIQDNWVSPPLNIQIADESKRQRATTIRVYNTIEKKWVLTIMSSHSHQPYPMTGHMVDGKMVLTGGRPMPGGYHMRQVFLDIKADSFIQKVEYSKDQIEWFEVKRLHATRKKRGN